MVSGCSLFRGNFVLKSRWEFESCLLSGIKKCPLLGGYLCISTIVISIHNTAFVRCREVVRFSEGPLWEVRLQNSGRTGSLCGDGMEKEERCMDIDSGNLLKRG